MNANRLELTQWDHAVIYYVKQENKQSIADIKKIWAERYELDVEDIHSMNLIDHFLPIVLKIGEQNKSSKYSVFSIIEDASPKNSWMLRDMRETESESENDSYYNRIFTVICSRLRLCESKYLPGFHEYYEQRKANCVICQ
jgi:hypothetical protein